MSELVHHSALSARDATPSRSVLFLHGILGQGINWRGVARRLVAAVPDYEAILVDLRGHGESTHIERGADSLASAAADLRKLMDTLERPADAVIGHSFGGKVALELAGADERVARVASIDSLPGERADHVGSEGTVAVLEMLEGLPSHFDDRGAFIAHVEGLGHRRALAQWLAQSLAESDRGGVRFGLDMRRVRALLDDYFARDLWPVVDPPRDGLHVSLIVGGRSSVWSAEARGRGRAIATREERVSFHVLEAADHWVHVDDPDGLDRLLAEALQ